MNMRYSIILAILCAFLSACGNTKSSEEENNDIPLINFSYAGYYPHDTKAFTEGLFIHDGKLFESTGSPDNLPQTKSLFGIVDLNTGVIDTKVELDRNQYFGEGIALINGEIFQLTYQSKVGFVYDASTFEKIKEFTIPSKEGWGLTTNGELLIMSDGTDKLTFLNPKTLRTVKVISVTENRSVLNKLNELEFINGYLYANIWMTNRIVKIDPENGKVVGQLDFTSFANEAKSIYPDALEMNGIAYDSATNNILITGKMWPKIYIVKLP